MTSDALRMNLMHCCFDMLQHAPKVNDVMTRRFELI